VATIPVMSVALFRWLATLTDLQIGALAAQFDAAIRSLSGAHTFFLAHGFLLTVAVWQLRGKEARWLKCFSAVLLVFVLLLNRRTVWIALIVGIGILVVQNRRLQRPAIALAVVGAIVASSAYLAFSREETYGSPVAQSATNTDTLSWRIDGWRILLSEGPDTWTEWLLGEPFGSGYARRIGGVEFFSQPHNFYVETFLRSGILGLAILIGLYAATLRALATRSGSGRGLLAPGVLFAVFTAQVIWFMAWAPGLEQGIITGLAASWAATKSRARVTPSLEDHHESSPLPVATRA